ncbi:MAG: hypothetical protein WC853_09050 [Thermodesulfovibrionales bacterium]
METKIVLERYAKYYEFLQKLGSFPLSETLTIEDLSLTKGVVQSGYKEMKEINFKGNLVDYLCLISTEYIVIQYKKFIKDNSFISAAKFIVESHAGDAADVNNLTRLAMKNPAYLYDLIGSTMRNEKTVKEKMDGFKLIYELWLKNYLIA